MLQEPSNSASSTPNRSRRTKFILTASAVLIVAAGAGGWFYYYWRLNDVPALPSKVRAARVAVGAIVLAPQSPAQTSTPRLSEETAPAGPAPTRYDPGFDPMEKVQANLNQEMTEEATREIAPSFEDVAKLLPGREDAADPRYQEAVVRLLDVVERAPVEQRPAILFAANLAARHLGCIGSFEERTAKCSQVQNDLGKYGIALKNDELGGGLYYTDDLLWRIWQEYPRTSWGEQVFVLLLSRGWDTSSTCAKGGDRTKDVIREGEAFLQQRPGSVYRSEVNFVVGEAYALWWSYSLSLSEKDPMADYLDPKQFQEGAAEARVKAIEYFERVEQLTPQTELGEYARDVLPHLKQEHGLEGYKFLCIYD